MLQWSFDISKVEVRIWEGIINERWWVVSCLYRWPREYCGISCNSWKLMRYGRQEFVVRGKMTSLTSLNVQIFQTTPTSHWNTNCSLCPGKKIFNSSRVHYNRLTSVIWLSEWIFSSSYELKSFMLLAVDRVELLHPSRFCSVEKTNLLARFTRVVNLVKSISFFGNPQWIQLDKGDCSSWGTLFHLFLSRGWRFMRCICDITGICLWMYGDFQFFCKWFFRSMTFMRFSVVK